MTAEHLSADLKSLILSLVEHEGAFLVVGREAGRPRDLADIDYLVRQHAEEE